MLPASTRRRSLLLASAAAFLSFPAEAQTSSQSQLPPVTVDAPQQRRAAATRPAQPAATRTARVRRAAPATAPPGSTSAPAATGLETPPGASLTVPTTEQARAIINRIPGGVELVPDTAFKNGPANTVKDVLGWVPGVITQPKSNIDNRISIRGSGSVAQLRQPRHQRLHGRHPDQHRGRPVRCLRDRSDRLPLCRGLQGRERAALRRQLAGWRDQFRHADRRAMRRRSRRGSTPARSALCAARPAPAA